MTGAKSGHEIKANSGEVRNQAEQADGIEAKGTIKDGGQNEDWRATQELDEVAEEFVINLEPAPPTSTSTSFSLEKVMDD